MRFLILTQYYPPEIGAAQSRLAAVARELQRAGHETRVVTALPNHPTGRLLPGYRMRPSMREELDGVTVDRVWLYPALGTGLRRLANYLSFAAACLVPLLRGPKPDYLFVESPPLFVMGAATIASRLRRIPIILNIADLWPDSVEQLGLATPGWTLRAFGALERWSYRRASLVTAVTDGIRDTLVGTKGLPPEKVLFLPNGVDLDCFRPADERPAEGPATFVYAGTHGVAHGLDTVLDAAELCADLEFVFVGDGSDKARLVEEAGRRGLANVRFLDPLPPAEVAALLRDATAGLACMRDLPVLQGARSAKVFAVMGSGRPVLYAGAGEDRKIIEAAGGGIVVPAGDGAALADGARRLAKDRALADELGRAARTYAEHHLGWNALVRDWLDQLQVRTERSLIQLAYRGYEEEGAARNRWDGRNAGNQAMQDERDRAVLQTLATSAPTSLERLRILDLGCGAGTMLQTLADRGADADRLVGLDVRGERIATARRLHPDVGLFIHASGTSLPFPDGAFDVVVMSTVLSSVTDDRVATRLAAEVSRVLAPGGIVVCYDLRYPNPSNRNVAPVSLGRLRRLFPGMSVTSRTLTLLPPLARRLGGLADTAYRPLAAARPLRSHRLSVLRRPDTTDV